MKGNGFQGYSKVFVGNKITLHEQWTVFICMIVYDQKRVLHVVGCNIIDCERYFDEDDFVDIT